MTLHDLERAVRQGDEPLLSIRQVSEITGTPYQTVRSWIYRYKVLHTIPVGPSLVPRIRGSVIVKLFCPPPSHLQ